MRTIVSTLLFSICLFSVCAVLCTSATAQTPAADRADWQELFNGKDLSEWRVKITGHALDENFADTFRVEDGLLKVRYDGYDRFSGQFGHLFYPHPLSHYALAITYRFVGEQAPGGPRGWAERNSGVMLHSQAPETMGLHQDFPVSIEAQFLGGLSDGKPRPTANVCTPGTHIRVKDKLFTPHCLPSASGTYDGNQWVTVTVVVLGGGSITHYVEGEDVLKYSHAQYDDSASHVRQKNASLSSGYIALQSESHPIDFKSVKLLNLVGCTDAKAKNYRPYYVKADQDKCRY